jgi:aerobic carbon-monoxide dehydrogenase large subunit
MLYVPRGWAFAFTNGHQASWLEVDPETGFVKLLKHWCVEDCGTIINPQLVDEQVRGGIVQGIGAALFEQCIYDERGQLVNGTMADYLVPMAGEMPDIEVGHVASPTADSELGAKGAGEAGTAARPGLKHCKIGRSPVIAGRPSNGSSSVVVDARRGHRRWPRTDRRQELAH